MIFNARDLARGWLSVALASANDEARPALYRTVAIEQFAEGVRLVATDSYMILRTWVPAVDHAYDPEPGLDEAPITTAVAIDEYGRGKGLLSHLLKLSTAKDALPIEVRLTLGVVEPEEGEGTFAGMDATWVIVEHPDAERLRLRAYEGEFPNWRKLFDGHTPQTTDAVALGIPRLTALAKLGKIHGDANPLLWRFGGEIGPAHVAVKDSDPFVEGLVMPVRVHWDFDASAPVVEVTKSEGEEA